MIGNIEITGEILFPIIYTLVIGFVIFMLWKIRDRQPGNTRYSVAIYAGIGGCILLMVLGFWVFGIL